MSWGAAGKGRWITVYANGGHTFMEVAWYPLRHVRPAQVTGSRWQNEFRSSGGLRRTPPGGDSRSFLEEDDERLARLPLRAQ